MAQRIAGSKTITLGLVAAAVGLAGVAEAQRATTPRTTTPRAMNPRAGATVRTPAAGANTRVTPSGQFDPRFNLRFDPRAGMWLDQSGGDWIHVGGMAQQALDPRIRGALNAQMLARVNAGFVPQNWLGTPFFPVIPNPATAAGAGTAPGATASGNAASNVGVRPRPTNTGRVRVDMTTVYGAGADVQADQSVRGNGTDADARTRLTVRDGDRTPERVLARMETIMDDQALANARVISTTKTSARLEFTVDGRTQTANVPLSRVFFIDANGSVKLASENRTKLGRGVRVLAPAPAELVAGSRKSTGTRTRTGTGTAAQDGPDDRPAR